MRTNSGVANAADEKGALLSRLVKSNLSSVSLFLIILVVLLSLATSNFATPFNVEVILGTFSITAVVGLSQMVIIATGGMNLAVGSIGGLSAILAGGAMASYGMGTFPSVVIGLLTGVICGLISGILIVRLGSSSAAAFLVTLAMSSAYRGISFGLTKAQPFYNLAESFKALGTGRFFGLPLIFYMMIGITLLLWVLFTYLGTGRQMLAFGSNPKAAQLYGVSAAKTLIIAHMLSGLLASCAGLMLMARLGSAQNDIGIDWMMFSFAAPIIGGARQAGGKVSVFGAVLGALVLATIQNGLVHLNIDVYWMKLIEGSIILLAVTVDLIRTTRDKSA